jgi:hypothetical protein
MATGWKIGCQGSIPGGVADFSLLLGPTQPPNQWVLGAIFPGVKRPEREADHSHLSARSRMRGAVPPPTVHLHGMVLIYSVLLLCF